MMEKVIIDSHKQVAINLYKQNTDSVVVIVHGASEGALRYSEFATKLQNQYNVITYTHPGHETGSEVNFSEDEILAYSKLVLTYAQDNFQKVTIFAHSMGTVIVRNLLIYLRDDTKLILSGAPILSIKDKIASMVGIVMLNCKRGSDVSSKMNYMIFDQKNSKIGLDDKAWLSTKEQIVELFKMSKLNNQLFTNRSLLALLELTLAASDANVYKQLRKHQLLLVSGGTDVFTNNGLNFKYILKKAPQAKTIIYPNSYHEIHNDVDKKKLLNDILKFIGR